MWEIQAPNLCVNDVGRTTSRKTDIQPGEPPVLTAIGPRLSLSESSLLWTTHCTVNSTLLLNGQVPFKLDMGAEVTAIFEQAYRCLPGVKLQPASQTLSGPSQQSLKIIGQFQASLACQGKEDFDIDYIYVILCLRSNLLGLYLPSLPCTLPPWWIPLLRAREITLCRDSHHSSMG